MKRAKRKYPSRRWAHGEQPYIFDHEHHRKLSDEIEGSLGGLLKAGSPSDWPGLSAKLYRQAVALNANSVDDREGMLRGFEEMVPPQMFVGMTQLLAGEVLQADWQERVRRVPDLGLVDPGARGRRGQATALGSP